MSFDFCWNHGYCKMSFNLFKGWKKITLNKDKIYAVNLEIKITQSRCRYTRTC